MHRKFWFLVAAAVAVFALTGTAAATSGGKLTVAQRAIANIKWTPQARATANQISFGQEQNTGGCNGLDIDQTLTWSVIACNVPTIRGMYEVTNTLVYKYDLASSVTSTKTALTINIKPGADWAVQGGGTFPVVAQDFALTYNVIMDPRNPVASTTGYSDFNQANPFTIVNSKKIVFHWAHPFADWKDLFGFVLPNFALPTANDLGTNGGQAFNEMWRDCVCIETLNGSGDVVDGANVSDGPYYVSSYTDNSGITLQPNHRWYGPDPQLTQVNFIRANSGSAEESGLASGTLDAAWPAPNAAYVPQKSDPNFTYQAVKAFVQEHFDFNEANPLLAHPWMRESIALGINRPALIKTVYYDSNIVPSGSMGQLNSPEYVLGKYSKAPYDYFKTWNFNQTRALSILSAHCTGGPSSPSPNNTKVWNCPDGKAQFNLLYNGAPLRGQSATIYQAELKQIGISLTPDPDSSIFTTILPNAQTNSCISGGAPQACGAPSYDIAEYAWGGGVDPSGFDAINECFDSNGKGGQNYKNYCNIAINHAQSAGDIDLTSTRYQKYLKVSKIISSQAYIFPLYARPDILIYHSGVGGMAQSNNPTSAGPTWNIEDWTH